MLFNSYPFLFLFLPIVLIGFYKIGQYSRPVAGYWLFAASLFFYGWWNIIYVVLLLASILFNFSVGMELSRKSKIAINRRKFILIFGVAANLSLLGYFKYANFFVENLNAIVNQGWHIETIILPLGISFFTFTQIAFLVDAYRGEVKEANFIHYGLFVTYFPHLIAGPVLHHKDMMPQFARHDVCNINWDNISLGVIVFVLGLAKKVLIADELGDYATPVFNVVAAGGHPMLFEAWLGALGYTLQLYFDFSAYSDMAIGLSLLFNVNLPINFNSPYKSVSIIEFWRRWHMTLSRFLRDYLYIPLGGNRRGVFHRFLNLMITMLLGGLWHGAGWTFVIWGGLHGVYLIINHAWQGFREKMSWGQGGWIAYFVSGAITFLAVVVGWVFFRADSIASALSILRGMAGFYGIAVPDALESLWWKFPALLPAHDSILFTTFFPLSGLPSFPAIKIVVLSLVIVWGSPNVAYLAQHINERYRNLYMSIILGLTLGMTLIYMRRVSTFLYFQF
ncbi:MAG: MBOAT family protein [Methylococcales bacterium]|nr:MBOAT family protein [Methylococcales bacterium]